ncbi:transposase family protein [Flavobacterium sp. UBA6046]|uniref:transposase family protein n=1 Tax=Flavobacterium sp. UBA6046 TaxID=1946552 RepID=UPI0025C6AE9C|nr:transposase family protein [Flavobacterium sp. UBA6046]
MKRKINVFKQFRTNASKNVGKLKNNFIWAVSVGLFRMKKPMSKPIEHFSSLTDLRGERTKEHLLEDIIFITIAAVICGAENWNDIEACRKSKQEWLSDYLKPLGGTYSHETFNHVFSALESWSLQTAFYSGEKA